MMSWGCLAYTPLIRHRHESRQVWTTWRDWCTQNQSEEFAMVMHVRSRQR